MEAKLLKIKELLRIKNLTYEEFAKLIGVSKPTVVNYFNERSTIDINLIEKIANVLNVPISYFFSEKENIKYENPYYAASVDILMYSIGYFEKDVFRLCKKHDIPEMIDEIKNTPSYGLLNDYLKRHWDGIKEAEVIRKNMIEELKLQNGIEKDTSY